VNLSESSIGFIGAGNMARSLIQGLLNNGIAPSNIFAADIDQQKLQELESEFGIQTADSNSVANSADVLVMAVKPQVMAQACADVFEVVQSRPVLLVSIAAGITISHLSDWLGDECAIVRCMPNTPALVGKGATGLYPNEMVSKAQKSLAEEILSAVGIALWLESETQIDAVTALSGSGPAYFFLLMEAMQSTAEQMGLDRDIARQLTTQTAIGAAELASQSSDEIAELRRQVTSPGGTTEAALNRFEQGGFRKLVLEALSAAQKRSEELANEFGSS
jgi:pyrroline-5-carboxylate reductase